MSNNTESDSGKSFSKSNGKDCTRKSLEVIRRITAERRTLENLIIPVSAITRELTEKVNLNILEITYIILEMQEKQTIIPKSPKIS